MVAPVGFGLATFDQRCPFQRSMTVRAERELTESAPPTAKHAVGLMHATPRSESLVVVALPAGAPGASVEPAARPATATIASALRAEVRVLRPMRLGNVGPPSALRQG